MLKSKATPWISTLKCKATPWTYRSRMSTDPWVSCPVQRPGLRWSSFPAEWWRRLTAWPGRRSCPRCPRWPRRLTGPREAGRRSRPRRGDSIGRHFWRKKRRETADDGTLGASLFRGVGGGWIGKERRWHKSWKKERDYYWEDFNHALSTTWRPSQIYAWAY